MCVLHVLTGYWLLKTTLQNICKIKITEWFPYLSNTSKVFVSKINISQDNFDCLNFSSFMCTTAWLCITPDVQIVIYNEIIIHHSS